MRHVIALSVFVSVVAAILVIGSCGRIGLPANSFDHKPAITNYANYTVQTIDGCEYILYQTTRGGWNRRMIHSASCENHGLARELREGF